MKRLFIVVALLALVAKASAQTAAPSDVHVKLSFAENKTVYRIGEPIKLWLEFTADREGYSVEILPDGKELGMDVVVISPDTGVTHWLEELNDNRFIGRDYLSTQKLSSTARVEIILNDKVRFDSPGRFSVQVTTRRITAERARVPLVLTTEPISFEVQPMSEADEGKEVKRLSDLLDAKHDFQNGKETAKQFSYLTGDTSTREKVRRFLQPESRMGGNYETHLWYGLFIARNRALTLKLIENGLRDPNVAATAQILNAAIRLKYLLTYGVSEKRTNVIQAIGSPSEDPRNREIREAYVLELAAGLGKRTGPSQTTTAVTILTSSPNDSPLPSAGLREARRILVQQFDSLHPFTQEWILRQSWEELRDPVLVPSYKKLFTTTGVAAKSLREGALKLLMEIAPDEARARVIAEIRDPNSLVDPKLLGAIGADSLPEVDSSLADQIRSLTRSNDNRARVYLKFKTALLVRFATESVYSELLELYQTEGDKLENDARAGLLAYFAKHNEREAVPLIEKALSDLEPGSYLPMLGDLTELYYSDAIGDVLKKVLETGDYAAASTAAYLIGKHGSADDVKVLEARLKRWREEWRERVADADAQNQGQIERELIYALVNGKSWKLPAARVQELKSSCITKICKQSNRAQ